MPDTPFFSIIIPTYNRQHTIAQTLDSCLQQGFFDYEIIVVDDGSTDNTFNVVQKYLAPNIHYYKKENGERAAARNFGMERAKGAYVTFLDSDDAVYADFLQNVHEKITAFNYPAFFIQAYEICSVDNARKSRVKYTGDIYIMVTGNPLSCIGNFIKKEVAAEYRFNEDRRIIRSEDWELWIRIIARYGFAFDNRVSCCVYDHDERSVRNFNMEQLVEHKYRAITSAFNDPYVIEKYGKRKKQIYAYCDTYISLHLALAGKKGQAFRFLLSGTAKHPRTLFSRRFLAIVKHILFRW